jgi:valyl-tRNA synthetase
VDLHVHCSADEEAVLEADRDVLEMLATASLQEAGPDVSEMADAATAVIGEMQIFIGGLIDAEAERDRLSKRQEELAKNRNALQGRLNNKGYVEKAPAHLVQETRDKLAEVEAELERIEANLSRLEAGA